HRLRPLCATLFPYTTLFRSFVLWERRVPYPMFDTRLFKNPRFSAASLSVTMVFFGLFGATFFLTQHMQFVLGFDTLQTGVRMIPDRKSTRLNSSHVKISYAV